mgnify:CR=1 FL=1
MIIETYLGRILYDLYFEKLIDKSMVLINLFEYDTFTSLPIKLKPENNSISILKLSTSITID